MLNLSSDAGAIFDGLTIAVKGHDVTTLSSLETFGVIVTTVFLMGRFDLDEV